MTMEYRACPTCGVALANADTSGISPEDLQTVESSIEAVGLVALTRTITDVEYFDCWFCHEVCMDESTIWTGEERP